jgi:hypothetical protein
LVGAPGAVTAAALSFIQPTHSALSAALAVWQALPLLLQALGAQESRLGRGECAAQMAAAGLALFCVSAVEAQRWGCLCGCEAVKGFLISARLCLGVYV